MDRKKINTTYLASLSSFEIAKQGLGEVAKNNIC